MNKIASFIRLYFYDSNRTVLLLVTLLTALMITGNYSLGIDKWVNSHDSFWLRFSYRYIIFLAAFMIPYVLHPLTGGNNYLSKPLIIALIVLSPAIFSLKMSMSVYFVFSGNSYWDHYWNQILYWPLRLLVIVIVLFFAWRLYYRQECFFGFTFRNFEWRPYAFMLLLMVPLILLASTQPDFLRAYPKLKMVATDIEGQPHTWLYKLLFELSYGSDFISIELFFRGFLVLAFIKWAGKDAILPMACFYCSIHFGKPLGECISSYFGGMLLGIVVYHTRSVIGGLMVHLGIAWLMELGGYFGSIYFGK